MGPPPMPGQMGGPMGSPMGPEPPMMSSVPITPELDNHEVEAEICKAWLKSEVGQDLKGTPGYANVLAHLKEHLMQIMMNAPHLKRREVDQILSPSLSLLPIILVTSLIRE